MPGLLPIPANGKCQAPSEHAECRVARGPFEAGQPRASGTNSLLHVYLFNLLPNFKQSFRYLVLCWFSLIQSFIACLKIASFSLLLKVRSLIFRNVVMGCILSFEHDKSISFKIFITKTNHKYQYYLFQKQVSNLDGANGSARKDFDKLQRLHGEILADYEALQVRFGYPIC